MQTQRGRSSPNGLKILKTLKITKESWIWLADNKKRTGVAMITFVETAIANERKRQNGKTH